MSDDCNLPATTNEPPDPEWEPDTDTYLLEVNRFDRSDNLLATQYFVLIVDSSESGQFISSSHSEHAEPVKD